jgi:predicted RNA-binding protein with TRAM domain
MRTCPIIVGNDYEVYIRQMSPRGEGIARVKGFLVFIENAHLGDHLMVKITNLNSISANAKIINSV